jgi:hypothetical protein
MVLLLTNGSVQSQLKSDRENAGLRGAVQSVRTYRAEKDEVPQTNKKVKGLGTVHYDQNGNEVETIIYDDYGFLFGREIHHHDVNGLRTESVLSDEKGKRTERKTYAYEKGKLSRINVFDGQGKAVLQRHYSYDSLGRLNDEIYYQGGRVIGKTIYSYDQKGFVSQVRFLRADGSKAVAPIGPCLGAHRVAYSYNPQGKQNHVTAFEPNGEIKKTWKYVYGPDGELKEDVRESVWSIIKFTYSYEFDAKANWIRQVAIVEDRSKTFSDGEVFSRESKTIREIKYY